MTISLLANIENFSPLENWIWQTVVQNECNCYDSDTKRCLIEKFEFYTSIKYIKENVEITSNGVNVYPLGDENFILLNQKHIVFLQRNYKIIPFSQKILKQRKKEVSEFDLPHLKGSEKQIKWAANIREEKLLNCWLEMKFLKRNGILYANLIGFPESEIKERYFRAKKNFNIM